MNARMFSVTPVYDLLLRGTQALPVGLSQLHLATADQLCRLHYKPGCITTVKARLKDLTDQGFIQADAIPTKRARSPYYYALAQKGLRYLEDAGCDTSETFRASREANKHSLFIEHTLELNDVLISASLLRRGQGYYLDSFQHERSLKRRPYKATWRDQREGYTQTFTVIPDAFLDFRLALADGRQRRLPVILEHDRGTEEQRYFRRRIRAYIVLLKSEMYKELFGVRTLTIAFTTFAGEARRKQMREWTKAELAATNEGSDIGGAFYFATAVRPLDPHSLWQSACWYTVYSDQPVTLLAL
jgi:DNA-binding PadR family transcriptional regulator